MLQPAKSWIRACSAGTPVHFKRHASGNYTKVPSAKRCAPQQTSDELATALLSGLSWITAIALSTRILGAILITTGGGRDQHPPIEITAKPADAKTEKFRRRSAAVPGRCKPRKDRSTCTISSFGVGDMKGTRPEPLWNRIAWPACHRQRKDLCHGW